MWKRRTVRETSAFVCILALLGSSFSAPAAAEMSWLGMYDFDSALQEANDVLWGALRSCLVAKGADASRVPALLDRGADMLGVWTDSRLCLAQTCGYPYVTVLKEKVKVVATPIYDAPKCECTDYSYRSLVIVKADSPHQSLENLRGHRAAINSLDSNSGMNAFRRLIAPLVQKIESDISTTPASFFSEVKLSGGHLRSLAMVAEGEADVAAIDCVTFSLLDDLRPELTAQVRVLAKTEASPGLPLITSSAASASDVARLQACLMEVLDQNEDDETDINVLEWQLPGVREEGGDGAATALASKLKRARAILRIKGVKLWTNDEEAATAYQKLLDMEDEAKALGYPELK